MAAGGGLAKAFMEAARESGGLAIPDAAVMQVSQMIFEAASSKAAGGDIDTKDLTQMSLALQRLMLAKARLEDVRGEFVSREKTALEEAQKIAAGGGDASSAVDKVRQILGVTA